MSDKEKKAALSEEKATKKEKKANAADSGKSKKEKDKKSVFKRIAAWFKDLKKEFTKIIYITPEYEESAVRQLSRDADITVVKVVQGTDGSYVDTPGYAVIPVDAEHYREKVHRI